MANKKTTSTKKTKTAPKTKAVVKKSTVTKRTTKPVSKNTKKTVHGTEPYHPIFGIILITVCSIVAAVLLAALACSWIESYCSDARQFASEYTEVDKKNVFVYKTDEEIIDILEDGTGIVFLGYPSCPWCQRYAAMLNELAKEYGIKKIYYHNTYDGYKNNTEEYRKITEILNDHLQFDNVGNRHLYVPDSAFVIEGEIIGNDWETSKDQLELATPDEYWTEERVTAWKEKLAPYFKQIKEASGK